MQTTPLQSLAGVRILITRPKAEKQLLSEKLRALGAVTVELPTIAILPPAENGPLDRSIRKLSEYDWVIFTSVQGVRFFSKRMAALGEPADRLREVKVAAIGPATAAALVELGEKLDYVPEEFLSEKIAHGLGDVKGKRILLPRADIASKRLPELLKKNGAIVDEVAAYRTVTPDDLSANRVESILEQGVDVVTFTSASTVRNLADVVGAGRLEALLKGVKVACIGPVTAEAAKALGVHVDITAGNHTIDDLVEAIVNEVRDV
jgi:uroporphyrinogen III methyltransferase/synthase